MINTDCNDLAQMLRAMAFERAVSELRSILHTYAHDSEKQAEAEALIDQFISDFGERCM